MKKTLALFDFDGTITVIDSTLSFYKFLYNSKVLFLYNHYFLCLHYVLLYRLKLISYMTLKERRLDIHTSKYNDSELLKLSEEYYKKYYFKLLNPNAMDRINWHKNQGHELWVISASYDFLLQKWSMENGVNLITNKTSLDNCKRRINGRDVNYESKVEYLKLKVDLKSYSEIFAYGDSEGDKAMLDIANFKFYKPFRN